MEWKGGGEWSGREDSGVEVNEGRGEEGSGWRVEWKGGEWSGREEGGVEGRSGGEESGEEVNEGERRGGE